MNRNYSEEYVRRENARLREQLQVAHCLIDEMSAELLYMRDEVNNKPDICGVPLNTISVLFQRVKRLENLVDEMKKKSESETVVEPITTCGSNSLAPGYMRGDVSFCVPYEPPLLDDHGSLNYPEEDNDFPDFMKDDPDVDYEIDVLPDDEDDKEDDDDDEDSSENSDFVGFKKPANAVKPCAVKPGGKGRGKKGVKLEKIKKPILRKKRSKIEAVEKPDLVISISADELNGHDTSIPNKENEEESTPMTQKLE